MPRRKLELLERLARLQKVERLCAATQAAEAQAVHRKLEALHLRSTAVASGIGAWRLAMSGDDFARQVTFAGGVQRICSATAEESRKAEREAQDALVTLRQAERRHDLVGEQVAAQQSRIATIVEVREVTGLARNLKSR
ncbi:hypothetical protein [Parerythrobacter lacustris]|uniref:Flagellar FliJ protein n=1 Tax=Parerythrobacter lacustris TaxID=2969984 RepID=A0ABT1XMH9_9SPHN|nr:hypothetical protein [Parerythrobacter lacustris]MCR2832782.1 hypothetical protein [Parerythrobacter lacustris]